MRKMEVELKEGEGHSRLLLLEEKGWVFLVLTFLTLGEGPKVGMGFDR